MCSSQRVVVTVCRHSAAVVFTETLWSVVLSVARVTFYERVTRRWGTLKESGYNLDSD